MLLDKPGELLVPRYQFHDPELAKMAGVATDLNSLMLTYLAAAYASTAINGILAASTTFYMSIHSSSPSNTGANELVAGTAYTAVAGGRPPLTFGAVSSGVQTSSDTQTYAMLVVEAGGINYFGIWTANTSGTYITGGTVSGAAGSIPSGANVTFTNSVVCEVVG